MTVTAPRANSVIAAAEMVGHAHFDTIILPHDGRHRRRITMRTEGDFVFLLDLSEATRLRHGDGLLLEDGRIIGVIAAEEAVVEITSADPHHLARIAWHIGNRHVPAEILSDRIRILPDHTIEDMVRGLGGHVAHVEAAFEPEGGAYEHAIAHVQTHGHAQGGHGHAHSPGDHAHDHDHPPHHHHGKPA